jgi:hypothetical protein
VNRTYNDVAQALSQYSTLSPRTEVYSTGDSKISGFKANMLLQHTKMADLLYFSNFQAPFPFYFAAQHTDFL